MAQYKNNPAGRLLRLTTAASNAPENSTAVKAWAKVFGMEADHGPVALKLGMVLAQIGLVREFASDSGIEPEGWEDQLRRLENALGFRAMDQNWNSHRSDLQRGDIQTALRYLSRDMSEEGDPLPDEIIETEEIVKVIQQLALDITGADLPYRLRSFLLRALREMERALIDSAITGPTGISETTVRIVADAADLDDDLKTHEAAPEVARFKTVSRGFAAKAGAASKVLRLIAAGVHILKDSADLLQIGPGTGLGPQ